MKYLTNQNLSFNSLAVIYIGPVIKKLDLDPRYVLTIESLYLSQNAHSANRGKLVAPSIKHLD